MKLSDVRNLLLLAYVDDIIDEEEFCLLYDLNRSPIKSRNLFGYRVCLIISSLNRLPEQRQKAKGKILSDKESDPEYLSRNHQAKKNICVFRVTRPCLNFLFKFRRP